MSRISNVAALSLRDVKKRLSCRFEARSMHKEKTFACTAQNDEIWQLFTTNKLPFGASKSIMNFKFSLAA